MKRLSLLAVLLLAACSLTPHLSGQAAPTAFRRGGLQLGAGYSFSSPDYDRQDVAGFAGWADLYITQHISVEAILHKNSIFTPSDIGEDTYLFGPRYSWYYKRFEPYVKVLGGYGVFQTQYDFRPHTSDGYLVYAGGGGLDYLVRDHVKIRAIDFEAQRWPNFGTGLSPYAFSFGGSYVF